MNMLINHFIIASRAYSQQLQHVTRCTCMIPDVWLSTVKSMYVRLSYEESVWWLSLSVGYRVAGMKALDPTFIG